MCSDNVPLLIMGIMRMILAGKKGQKKRFWSDDEKRSICAQTTVAGVSVAQIARRYAMNALALRCLSGRQKSLVFRRTSNNFIRLCLFFCPSSNEVVRRHRRSFNRFMRSIRPQTSVSRKRPLLRAKVETDIRRRWLRGNVFGLRYAPETTGKPCCTQEPQRPKILICRLNTLLFLRIVAVL